MYEHVFLSLSFCKGGATSLNIAAQEGHVPVLQFLLDKGAAIETKNTVRKTEKRDVDLPYPVHPYLI